jgi:hypothetical protein
MASNSINTQNIQHVREQIARKKGDNPYLATIEQSAQVLTDYDTFPYPRWFRGIPQFVNPIVAEREAGWRTRHDTCYEVRHPPCHMRYPDHCFQPACSTVFPCFTRASDKFSSLDRLEDIINHECIVKNY